MTHQDKTVSRQSKLIRLAIQVGVSVAALGALFWFLSDGTFMEQVLDFDPLTVVLVCILTVLQVVTATVRWDLILASYHIHFPFLTVLRVQLASLFVALFLPASIGGGIGKLLLLIKAAPPLKVLESVILDKLFALLSLTILCVFSIVGIVFLFPESIELFYQQALVVTLFTVGFLALLLKRKGHRFAHKITKVLNEIPRLSLDIISKISSISLLTTLLTIIAFTLIADSKIEGLNLSTFILLVPPVMLAAALPISFNGWGVREAASVVVFGLIGINSDTAIAVSFQFGVISTIPSLLGSFCWFLLPPETRENAQADTES